MSLKDWLESLDPDGFLAQYHESLVSRFDSVVQLLEVYTTKDGEVDPQFFEDVGIKKLGHRRLFQQWFRQQRKIREAKSSHQWCGGVMMQRNAPLCIGWLLLSITAALKVQVPFVKADAPFLLLLSDVGFTPGVELTVNISSDRPGAVFLLLSATQLHDWLHSPPRANLDGNLSSYFASQWRQPLSSHLSTRIDLDLPKVDFFYAGIFDPTFDGGMPKVYQIELDFVNAHGQHLPSQWAKLPLVWGISSVAFSFFVQGAVILTSTSWYRASTPMHGLLSFCAALKAVELVVRADLFRVLSMTGDAPPWKFQVWRLLHYVTDTFELLVMVLIALGREKMNHPMFFTTQTWARVHCGLKNDLEFQVKFKLKQSFRHINCKIKCHSFGRCHVSTAVLLQAMSWKQTLERELSHARSWKKAVEVIGFLQGEWKNAEDSTESYFVTGTSVRRTNARGTKTFEKHLVWEDRWNAVSWGPNKGYYLDTPKPHDQTVKWSAYKRGGKPFRWNRPKDDTERLATCLNFCGIGRSRHPS
eukprot:symbB.v1.2.016212.t1/scaffold1231.1/size130510/5